MLNIALWEPEIPPNTGNIARLCAANGIPLHLIGRLGFRLDEKSLKRAGLDYWNAVEIVRHNTFHDFEQTIDPTRIFCLSAHAERSYDQVQYQPGDTLLFGSESRGLPDEIKERYLNQMLIIPMLTNYVRSLNLATAVGVVLYEALRQIRAWD
mgnify:CR=1 FL=1